jgi:hypothetical protein
MGVGLLAAHPVGSGLRISLWKLAGLTQGKAPPESVLPETLHLVIETG